MRCCPPFNARLVCATRPHTENVERVVGIGFEPGLDPGKVTSALFDTGGGFASHHVMNFISLVFFQIVSASQAGDMKFLDMRNYRDAYLTIKAHRGSLTALAVHRHAPIIASGSAKQMIKLFSLNGEPLGSIRYHLTIMALKIGPVSCLTFHPYQVLLAAGATDALFSIYADDNTQAR